jgi:hypothetical protein
MKSKLVYWFFILTLYELVLMGSGQILKIGPLTLRMILFISGLILSLSVIFIKKRIEKYFVIVISMYSLLSIAVPLLIAVINKNPVPFILNDLKPLIFFYSIIFFSLIIKDENIIIKINQIIKTGAIILAVSYLLAILALYTGLLDFTATYARLDATGEFFFRGSAGFFYKGFLYLCVGVFFFLNKASVKNSSSVALLLTAIILTLTRGFIVTVMLVLVIYLLMFYKNKIVSLIILTAGAILIFMYIGIYTDTIGDKSESDKARYTQVHEVIDETNPFSFFVGYGFGKGTESREGHIEISYLEIFHKQGILGLAFWLILLIWILYSYYKAKLNGNKQMALPYLLSCIFVYLQSFTNPFINNPIGMSVIVISMVVLKRLETLKPTIAI